MLETEMKKLTESITALKASVDALHATYAKCAGAIGLPTEEVVTTLEQVEQQVADKKAEDVTDAKPEEPLGDVTLPDLGAYLSKVANQFGAPAQDAIKGIILETGGTQALSQVDAKALPIIKQKVEAWVAAQS